jgi:hypothetical protein
MGRILRCNLHFIFAVQFQRRIAGRTSVKRTQGRFILGAIAYFVFICPVFSSAQESQEKVAPDASAAQQGGAQPAAEQTHTAPDQTQPDQTSAPNNAQTQQTKPQEQLPNAPSSSKTEPSLEDLGFSASQAKGDAKQQALLDKRTHMLKVHQRMGLITTGPMIATVIASFGAGGKQESRASRDLHTALGGLTGDLYFMTAYYAIRAPKIKGTETRGPIRFHKAMAWIHGPGMIAAPILGIMAFDQKNKGEKVHGIAQAHGPVAIVTAGAFGAALLSVSVKF